MIMPLWDKNPMNMSVLPVVTWGIIAANVITFIIAIAASPGVQATMFHHAAVPSIITSAPFSFSSIPIYSTLVTSQFLHADIFHLIGNMIFLWIFGDDVEEAMGPLRFLGFYLFAGSLAALSYAVSTPHSIVPLVGASGAIAGVLAAYLMFRPCQKVAMFFPVLLLRFVRPIVWIDAVWVLSSWALFNFWQVSVQAQDDVAYMAHLGGFVAGAVIFPALRQRTVRLFECNRQSEEPTSI